LDIEEKKKTVTLRTATAGLKAGKHT